MAAAILDGKERASHFVTLIRESVADAAHLGKRPPGLAVVLAGDDPASQVYVRTKEKRALECGFHVVNRKLSADCSLNEVLDVVRTLNRDSHIDGILVQMPLPRHLPALEVIQAIDPQKDADGLHPYNQGLLFRGDSGHSGAPIPCTPLGIMKMLDHHFRPEGGEARLSGCHAVVVGRSTLVGKPAAALLLARDATVTIAHSKTADLPRLCLSADILVAAVGVPKHFGGDHIRPGAVVIDVGINRLADGSIVGDVDFVAAREIADAITPVPGGVGPMTVAMLLFNTFNLYARHHLV